MVQHFTFVQLPAVLTGWGASWVLLAVATGAVAVRTAKAGIERPDQSQVLQVGSGPNPLKCQPFVVLYRMDRAGNGDGVLDPEEIPRGAESFVQRLVTESKVASPTNTPLRQMAIAWHRRTPRSTGRLPKSVVTQPDRSRALRRESMASHRDRAASFLGLYDRNGNGSLEQDEWNRIGAGWDEGDVDGNGALSLDELSDRFMAYERPPSGLGNESAPPGSVGNAPEDRHLSAHAPRSQAEATPSRHRKSYRRRTPHERLPTGIPGWYIQKDADRDGQIMMVEFAKAWNDEELAEFNRYDFNRDGIITPRECLKAKAQR